MPAPGATEGSLLAMPHAMRNIDEDTITQAVIARHAGAADARLRDVMTSLVQHLHGFAREVKLTENEWREGMRFLAEAGRLCNGERQELALLSDTLGLSTLVTALNRRKPKGCTESTPAAVLPASPLANDDERADAGAGGGEPCYVRGQVRSADGTPLAGAEIRVWQAGARGALGLASGADGRFHFKGTLAQPHAIPHDGPVGRLLQALGRHPWRPAHLHFLISAAGHERLVTHVFRNGDRYLDSDAVFGVRRSLIADWVRHEAGPAPDGDAAAVPFYTLDFDFVLARA
jgi:hydroxyquinol 1,2-dioxygenase